MLGKLYRQMKDGSIYEVIGQADDYDASRRWVVWSERTGERLFIPEMNLVRQIGWDLVGRAEKSGEQETAPREAPPALMK